MVLLALQLRLLGSLIGFSCLQSSTFSFQKVFYLFQQGNIPLFGEFFSLNIVFRRGFHSFENVLEFLCDNSKFRFIELGRHLQENFDGMVFGDHFESISYFFLGFLNEGSSIEHFMELGDDGFQGFNGVSVSFLTLLEVLNVKGSCFFDHFFSVFQSGKFLSEGLYLSIQCTNVRGEFVDFG